VRNEAFRIIFFYHRNEIKLIAFVQEVFWYALFPFVTKDMILLHSVISTKTNGQRHFILVSMSNASKYNISFPIHVVYKSLEDACG